MKRYMLIALLVFSLNQAKAQYWATDSSVWHIGIIESIISPAQGYIRIDVIGDTLLQGQSCKVLNKVRHYSTGAIANVGNDYMYEDSGKVYHFVNNTFYTLYDFNAMPGDSWIVSVPFPSPWCGIGFSSCDTLVRVVVDSVSTITIQSQVLKTLYVHSDSSDWLFYNPIIENIGSAGGLFPYIYGWMDVDIPFLRCYQDSLIYYQVGAPFTFPCDSLISSVEQIGSFWQANVFPNPFSEYINVTVNSHEADFVLFDVSSRMLFKETFNGSTTVHLESLSKGVYFYEIRDNQQVLGKGKVFKQ